MNYATLVCLYQPQKELAELYQHCNINSQHGFSFIDLPYKHILINQNGNWKCSGGRGGEWWGEGGTSSLIDCLRRYHTRSVRFSIRLPFSS